MTREEEIYNAMGDAEWKHIDGTKDIELFDMGFKEGAKWADAHPNWTEIVKRMQEEIINDLRNDRWISVDEELPKEKGWILAVAGDVDMFEYEGESAIVLKDMYHITHWMSLPFPPIAHDTVKLKGEEDIIKNITPVKQRNK